MSATSQGLLTDLYQLNMMQAYLDHGMRDRAIFELFFRKLPPGRRFLMAAGLEQALGYLETLRFSAADLDWLKGTGRFGRDFLDYLASFRFTGNVHAMAEGTVFFPDEPIFRVSAPLPEAQLVESRLLNILHFQTLIASSASLVALPSSPKPLVDFGFRRAHGDEAGVLAARAAYIAGFAATATVEAGRRFGIPLSGTMAHSFVQAHADETAAFEDFARSRPDRLVLLIDTYDTAAGARKVAELAPRLAEDGIAVTAVRIDSGDLGAEARRVRDILDAAGRREVGIFASGGIDEMLVARLEREGAPIDGYGIGTSLTTSSDIPALDCAYKLQDYADVPRRKRSVGKATWPGAKQVYRRFDADGRIAGDLLTLAADPQPGTPLIAPVMMQGRRIAPPPTIEAIRARAAAELDRLPTTLRSLEPGPTYDVVVSEALTHLAAEVDRRTG